MSVDNENELFRKVLEARDHWLKEILANGVISRRSLKESEHDKQRENDFYMKGTSDKSPKKTLYLVLPEIWNKVARDEMEMLKTELVKAKASGTKISRKLWLPTVIEDAEKILAKAYEAKSVRKVSLKTARNFALKAGLDKRKIEKYLSSEDREYWTSTISGKKYKLKVTNLYGSHIYPFTDWAVCLCTNETIPIIKKRIIQKTPAEDHSKIILCSRGNVTLFIKR